MESLLNLAQKASDLIMDCRRHPQPSTTAPGVVAHRGCWDRGECGENSLAAFTKAAELKAWGIEFDVHFTKDDFPIVHHDPDLGRVFRIHRKVEDLTLNELKTCAPNIPQLSEVLEHKNLHFMIEIKTRLSDRQADILKDHLARLNPIENYHLLALDPELLKFNRKMPKESWILVGELNLKPYVKEALARDLGGVAGHYLGMTKKLMADLHKEGKKAGVGFVPTRNLYCREWSRGVDWVFTNDLVRLKDGRTP